MQRYLLVVIIATVATTICAKYMALPPKVLVLIVSIWFGLTFDFLSRLLCKKSLIQFILFDL